VLSTERRRGDAVPEAVDNDIYSMKSSPNTGLTANVYTFADKEQQALQIIVRYTSNQASPP
jgi:hypothetical protein